MISGVVTVDKRLSPESNFDIQVVPKNPFSLIFSFEISVLENTARAIVGKRVLWLFIIPETIQTS